MKLRRIARRSKEWLQLLAGRVPSCRWVRFRLGAYHHWDPSLSRLQFGAIEKHLSECPECRAEWERTSALCHNLERLRRGMAGEPSIEEQVAHLMVRINDHETEQAACREIKLAWFSQFYKPAAVCLLLIALPVLGYVGYQVLTGGYFAAGESVSAPLLGYKYSAKARVTIEALALVCLLMIALPLVWYMGHQVLRRYFRPKEAVTGVKFHNDNDSRNAGALDETKMSMPLAEKPSDRSQGGRGVDSVTPHENSNNR